MNRRGEGKGKVMQQELERSCRDTFLLHSLPTCALFRSTLSVTVAPDIPDEPVPDGPAGGVPASAVWQEGGRVPQSIMAVGLSLWPAPQRDVRGWYAVLMPRPPGGVSRERACCTASERCRSWLRLGEKGEGPCQETK